MTPQEAIKILHPDTTVEAIAETEYYAGFKGREAGIKAVEDACVVACEALEKQIPKKPEIADTKFFDYYMCPTCKENFISKTKDTGKWFCGRLYHYCPNCGQKIDWSE